MKGEKQMANGKGKTIKFTMMTSKGDEDYTYELATAEEKFDELVALNTYTPMAVMAGGSPEILPSFRGDVTEIIWIPKIAGG
jgi:hypothetical protein